MNNGLCLSRRTLLTLACLPLPADAAGPDAILVNRLTKDGVSKVEVVAQKAAGGSVCDRGRVVSTLYTPQAGKGFPEELSIAGDGHLQLKVQAGLLSRTDYWTR